MFYGSTSGGGEAGLEAAVSLGAVIQFGTSSTIASNMSSSRGFDVSSI